MSTPFIGEIRMFAGTFAPLGWEFCNGQSMLISEASALFNVIGTTYGGDGVSNFKLPNLMGRLPMHQAPPEYPIGKSAGAENVTLATQEMPAHSHAVSAVATASAASPSGAVYGGATQDAIYTAGTPNVPMNANMVAMSPPGQAHNNVMPFGVVNFIIATEGEYPSRS